MNLKDFYSDLSSSQSQKNSQNIVSYDETEETNDNKVYTIDNDPLLAALGVNKKKKKTTTTRKKTKRINNPKKISKKTLKEMDKKRAQLKQKNYFKGQDGKYRLNWDKSETDSQNPYLPSDSQSPKSSQNKNIKKRNNFLNSSKMASQPVPRIKKKTNNDYSPKHESWFHIIYWHVKVSKGKGDKVPEPKRPLQYLSSKSAIEIEPISMEHDYHGLIYNLKQYYKTMRQQKGSLSGNIIGYRLMMRNASFLPPRLTFIKIKGGVYTWPVKMNFDSKTDDLHFISGPGREAFEKKREAAAAKRKEKAASQPKKTPRAKTKRKFAWDGPTDPAEIEKLNEQRKKNAAKSAKEKAQMSKLRNQVKKDRSDRRKAATRQRRAEKRKQKKDAATTLANAAATIANAASVAATN